MIATGRRAVLTGLGAAVLLAGCGVGGTFRTDYPAPIPADVSRGWRVVDVSVLVPEALSVSEAKSALPDADIVWREDPAGDRRAQVAEIVRNAAIAGSQGLRGPRRVRMEITVTRFHALTFEAEQRFQQAGVHNISFVAQVTDASSGEILAGPAAIEAALPALSGDQMRAARERGETQKSQISAHLRKVFAGWLGIGPDPRDSFRRAGN